nr:SPOR domain-containing protein [Treponema sp.]
MRKNVIFASLLFCVLAVADVHAASVDLSAKDLMMEASQYKTLDESLGYLRKTVPNMKNAADRRYGYAFLASVQEQMGQYADAQKSYAAAAAIDAGNAVGVPKKTSEQLVIDSVRCALSVGDSSSADRYLDSAVKNSKDEKIIAYVKLYTQWSALCKADDFSDTKTAVSALKSYLSEKSMKIVHPQILLTLYHITGQSEYSKKLKSDFPGSMEAGILDGSVGLLPTPFWYFVPRSETSVADIVPSVSVQESKNSPEAAEKPKSGGKKVKKQQIGYFRDEDNANKLVKKLRGAGFSGKIQKETKPSGNTYYLVYVEENEKGDMASKLKAAGFDCLQLSE